MHSGGTLWAGKSSLTNVVWLPVLSRYSKVLSGHLWTGQEHAQVKLLRTKVLEWKVSVVLSEVEECVEKGVDGSHDVANLLPFKWGQ